MSDNIEKIREFAETNGNNFHCKVFRELAACGWSVDISPYYHDNITDKPREIDIIAELEHQYRPGGGLPSKKVLIQLFIECKYINSDTVFWFANKNKNLTASIVERMTSISTENAFNGNHHYNSENEVVAKLFASKNGDTVFKAVNQCLHSLISFKDRNAQIPLMERIASNCRFDKVIRYPLIACNSFKDVYRVEVDNEPAPKSIDAPFLLEISYAYLDKDRIPKNEAFLIDVLDLNSIERYTKLVTDDAHYCAQALSYA